MPPGPRRHASVELSPCPRCGRHIRVDEPRCAFCRASQDVAAARAYVRRLKFEAAFGAAMLTALMQCRAGAPEIAPASPPPSTSRSDGAGREPAALALDGGLEDATDAPDAVLEAAIADVTSDWPQRSLAAIYSACEIKIVDTVAFEPDSTKVTLLGQAVLASVASVLGRYRTIKVEIRGYVTESEARSRGWLADMRARHVQSALVRSGVDPGRLRVATWRRTDAGAVPLDPGVSFSIFEGSSCTGAY